MSLIGNEEGIEHGTLRGHRQHTRRKVPATEACGCPQAKRDDEAAKSRAQQSSQPRAAGQHKWNGGQFAVGTSRPEANTAVREACTTDGCGQQSVGPFPKQRGWVRVHVAGSTEPARDSASPPSATSPTVTAAHPCSRKAVQHYGRVRGQQLPGRPRRRVLGVADLPGGFCRGLQHAGGQFRKAAGPGQVPGGWCRVPAGAAARPAAPPARPRSAKALRALPVDYRTGLVRRRALDLYEAIPAQHHHERAVRELWDALAA